MRAMMRPVLLLALAAVSVAHGWKAIPYKNITNGDLAVFAQDPSFVIVDLRPPAVFRAGHIQGAASIPLDRFSRYGIAMYGQRAPVLVSDAAGMAGAVQAAESLSAKGLPSVFLASEGMESFAGPLTKSLPPYYTNTTAADVMRMVEMPYVIDVREPDEYAAGHVPAAFNIPRAHLKSRLAEIDVTKPVFVICKSGFRSTMATLELVNIHGLTDLWNIMDGTDAWRGPLEKRALPGYLNVSSAQLLPIYKSGFLVDVRTPEEFREGHIPGAHHIPVDSIVARSREIPQDGTPVYIYCKGGGRSLQATLMLVELKFKALHNLLGGIMEWEGPVVTAAALAPALPRVVF